MYFFRVVSDIAAHPSAFRAITLVSPLIQCAHRYSQNSATSATPHNLSCCTSVTCKASFTKPPISWLCAHAFFSCDLSLLPSSGGSGECKPSVSGAAVANSGKRQAADDKGGFFIGVFGCVMFGMVGAWPFAADGFKRGAGGGVAARFGGKVTATPRHR